MPYERYKRQTVLKQIGEKGQDELLKSSVLCVGAGGLACSLLQYLVAAGVGNITVLDFDTVDESNLQRQTLYTEDDIGKFKAETAVKALKKLNSQVNLTYHNKALTAENAKEFFTSHSIIVDASDNFATKFLVNDAAFKFNKKVVYGSILGFDGQVSVFDSKNNYPCYRCLYKEEPKAVVQNCEQAGVMGAVVGIIGSIQAMEVIKLIVKHNDLKPLLGKLFVLSASDMQSHTFNFKKKSDCPTCSKNRDSFVLKSNAVNTCNLVKEIDVDNFIALEDSFKIFDVREKSELKNGVIKNSFSIPLSGLGGSNLPNFNKEDKILVYCQSGIRSKNAGNILMQNGFKNVYSLKGGYNAFCKHK